jgi:hypothetical protein
MLLFKKLQNLYSQGCWRKYAGEVKIKAYVTESHYDKWINIISISHSDDHEGQLSSPYVDNFILLELISFTIISSFQNRI